MGVVNTNDYYEHPISKLLEYEVKYPFKIIKKNDYRTRGNMGIALSYCCKKTKM